MSIVNHYGVIVDSNKPITGVVSNNSVSQFINEEINYNGIDLGFLEHKLYCNSNDEYHEECYENYGESSDWLIGDWKINKDGKYEPDESGEYAAIVRETVTQVVWSKHTRRCALCSPCYPGQGDLDTPGEFLTYDLPSEAYEI